MLKQVLNILNEGLTAAVDAAWSEAEELQSHFAREFLLMRQVSSHFLKYIGGTAGLAGATIQYAIEATA